MIASLYQANRANLILVGNAEVIKRTVTLGHATIINSASTVELSWTLVLFAIPPLRRSKEYISSDFLYYSFLLVNKKMYQSR
jgi:hypothetical protein